MDILNAIALRRLNLWVNSGSSSPFQDFNKLLALEVGQLGFRFSEDTNYCLAPKEFQERIEILQQMRGGDVEYVPLFRNFPDQLPNDHIYFFRRIIGFFGLNTFNETHFGADPITQMQRDDLWNAAVAEQDQRLGDSRVQWINLEVISEDEVGTRLKAWVLSLIYSSTSIQETLWNDILIVLEELGVEPDFAQISFKETLARLASDRFIHANQIVVKTPTDLLRMLAYEKEQDVSLAKPVKFDGLKLKKAQRRAIVAFLDRCPSLEEDLLRYKPLWISLSKWIHPGDFIKKHPRVAQAFDLLRNNRIKSFQAQILNQNNPVGNRLALLSGRPGVFLRNLTLLMKEVPQEPLVRRLLNLDATQISLPLLLTVYRSLSYSGKRLVVTKNGKPWVLDPRKIGDTAQVAAAVKQLILNKLKGTQTWDKVWFDPALLTLVLPFQLRKQSEGLLPLARGSRIAAGDSEVIRIFVYWHENTMRTDLDLSVRTLDKDFNYVGFVSWSLYGSGDDVAHSGDIRSAPKGAAEFIDLRKSKLDCGYIAPAILKYGGENFNELKACYAGWMQRDDIWQGFKTFDAKTVVTKVDVAQGESTVWVPFLFDVEANEIIYVDLYSKGDRIIEGNKHLNKQVESLANSWKAKPTYELLVRLYAEANNATIVDSKEDATVTIGIDDDCSVNIFKLVGANSLTLLQ